MIKGNEGKGSWHSKHNKGNQFQRKEKLINEFPHLKTHLSSTPHPCFFDFILLWVNNGDKRPKMALKEEFINLKMPFLKQV